MKVQLLLLSILVAWSTGKAASAQDKPALIAINKHTLLTRKKSDTETLLVTGELFRSSDEPQFEIDGKLVPIIDPDTLWHITTAVLKTKDSTKTLFTMKAQKRDNARVFDVVEQNGIGYLVAERGGLLYIHPFKAGDTVNPADIAKNQPIESTLAFGFMDLTTIGATLTFTSTEAYLVIAHTHSDPTLVATFNGKYLDFQYLVPYTRYIKSLKEPGARWGPDAGTRKIFQKHPMVERMLRVNLPAEHKAL